MATLTRSKRTTTPDWEALATRYCTEDFIAKDPIAFAHGFSESPDSRNVECVAFLSALLSYGRRPSIQQAISGLISPLGEDPVSALCEASPKDLKRWTQGWYYRFNTATDAQFVLGRLASIYQADKSLKTLWGEAYDTAESLPEAISGFRGAFLNEGPLAPEMSHGIAFWFADPAKKSAAKRFTMFLRWMVRKDAVDLGLWQDVTPASALVIPLDTHVAQMARRYGITARNPNDWQTVEEITGYFRKLDPADPARFDFALFGLGIELAGEKRLDSSK